MARNASWKCVPFLWHAASRDHGVETCLRPVRALYTHFYAQFTQCANKMTAIDTQWNDLFTHTSRYLCAPPRIAPTTSRMREFVVAFFGTWFWFAARSIKEQLERQPTQQLYASRPTHCSMYVTTLRWLSATVSIYAEIAYQIYRTPWLYIHCV